MLSPKSSTSIFACFRHAHLWLQTIGFPPCSLPHVTHIPIFFPSYSHTSSLLILTLLSGFSVSVFPLPCLSLRCSISNIQTLCLGTFSQSCLSSHCPSCASINFLFHPVKICLLPPSCSFVIGAGCRRRAIVVHHTHLNFLCFWFACVASFHLAFALV